MKSEKVIEDCHPKGEQCKGEKVGCRRAFVSQVVVVQKHFLDFFNCRQGRGQLEIPSRQDSNSAYFVVFSIIFNHLPRSWKPGKLWGLEEAGGSLREPRGVGEAGRCWGLENVSFLLLTFDFH